MIAAASTLLLLIATPPRCHESRPLEMLPSHAALSSVPVHPSTRRLCAPFPDAKLSVYRRETLGARYCPEQTWSFGDAPSETAALFRLHASAKGNVSAVSTFFGDTSAFTTKLPIGATLSIGWMCGTCSAGSGWIVNTGKRWRRIPMDAECDAPSLPDLPPLAIDAGNAYLVEHQPSGRLAIEDGSAEPLFLGHADQDSATVDLLVYVSDVLTEPIPGDSHCVRKLATDPLDATLTYVFEAGEYRHIVDVSRRHHRPQASVDFEEVSLGTDDCQRGVALRAAQDHRYWYRWRVHTADRKTVAVGWRYGPQIWIDGLAAGQYDVELTVLDDAERSTIPVFREVTIQGHHTSWWPW